MKEVDTSKIESLVDFPLIPLGHLCNHCDCFRCKKLGRCEIRKPTTVTHCKDECNGRVSRNVCEYARKRGFVE